jgi:hypothetical protein
MFICIHICISIFVYNFMHLYIYIYTYMCIGLTPYALFCAEEKPLIIEQNLSMPLADLTKLLSARYVNLFIESFYVVTHTYVYVYTFM